jgi:hypothetical protein
MNSWRTLAVIFAMAFTAQPLALAADIELSAASEPCDIPGLFCIKLSAVNLSATHPVTVAAAHAIIQSSSGDIKPLAPRAVSSQLSKQQKRKKKHDQVAATVVSGGLATLTVGDLIDKKRGQQAWLGKITSRRRTTDTLFVNRVVLPLDHSEGLLYFSGPVPSSYKLRVPTDAWPPDAAVSMTNQVIEVAASSPR